MYFLYKEGVYGHGVFWIGEELEEGKKQADECASSDKDSYHRWVLYLYCEDQDPKEDDKHALVYTGVRSDVKE